MEEIHVVIQLQFYNWCTLTADNRQEMKRKKLRGN